MKNDSKRKPESPRELYLKVPYHILNIPQLGLSEKVLLAHFYSFGRKGCWQSNATLAEMFMTSERSISRWVSQLIKTKTIVLKCPKGYYRTIWAKYHPDVIETIKNKSGQNKSSSPRHYGEVTSPKMALGSAKKGISTSPNYLTTNNNTIKETTVETSATPAPLPAGGQAQALLAERRASREAVVATFYERFGRPRQPPPRRTSEEFERMRREAIEQVMSKAGQKERMG